MTINGWLQIFVFLALIFVVTRPLGIFMTRVFSRERTFLDPVLRPIERVLYRIQRFQGVLPFNPQHFAGVSPQHLAFNTAASFTTNTNWQSYSGETTMSYLTQ